MSDLEHCTDDYATVTWRGRQFHFSAYQREVIRLLLGNRGKALSQRAILERVGASSERLRDLFKAKPRGMHPAWGDLIHTHLQHGRGRDLFLVPPESPSAPPRGPQRPGQTSASGSSENDPEAGGTMVSRIPLDPVEWLDGEMVALCSDLVGERNFMRALLRWGAMQARASRTELRAASDRADSENLVAGFHYGVQRVLRGEASLGWLDGHLLALSRAWAGESPARDCPFAFMPSGAAGDWSFDLEYAFTCLTLWLATGVREKLLEGAEFVEGVDYPEDGTDPGDVRLVQSIIERLRSTDELNGRECALALADGLERGREPGYVLEPGGVQDDILTAVWSQ